MSLKWYNLLSPLTYFLPSEESLKEGLKEALEDLKKNIKENPQNIAAPFVIAGAMVAAYHGIRGASAMTGEEIAKEQIQKMKEEKENGQ